MIVRCVLAMVLSAVSALAHPLAPAVLELRPLGNGVVDVRWRESLPRPRGVSLQPMLPSDCRALAAPVHERAPGAVTTRWRADCGAAGLVGAPITVANLAAPLSVIVRVEFPDGRVADGVLTADAPRFVVPAAPRAAGVVRDYVRLGVEHIASGADHLLFVFGLVLLSTGWRQILATVTAFTVGHSVTLALATLGVVALPAGPIELAIALSVLVVAIEVAQKERTRDATVGRPWLLAGGFGLLHGLGFAAVLHDVGLPRSAIPLALFAFNVGIELGQVAFVVVLLALGTMVGRLAGQLPSWARRAPAYLMGTMAAYWCFERAAAWLAA